MVEVGAERVLFTLPLAEPDTPVTVTIAYQPQQYGREVIRAGLASGAEVQVTQFVYP
jgi:hypothetical protein